MHYIGSKSYDYIIIDEIDTFLHKWFDNDTIIDKAECWNILKRLLRQAKHVIFLDAFTTNLTFNFINLTKDKDDTIQLYERECEFSDITAELISSNMKWLNEIIDALKQNKLIYIFLIRVKATKCYQ